MTKRRKYYLRRYKRKEIVQRLFFKIKGLCAIFFIAIIFPYGLYMCAYHSSMDEKNVIKMEDTDRIICVKVKGSVGEEYIPMEQYLIGALATSIDLSYEEEALKAQTILLRSTILHNKVDKGQQSGRMEVVDLKGKQAYVSVHDMQQMYGDQFAEIYCRLKKIVEDTKGIYLSYEGKPVEGVFCALSAGKTRGASEIFNENNYPYLEKTECHYDLSNQNYSKRNYFVWSEFYEKLHITNQEEEKGEGKINIIKRDSADYVVLMQVGERKMTGEEFRNLLQLNSSNFEVEELKAGIQILTKGIGHGFGMSQYTANELAKKGYDSAEILSYFFKNLQIEKQ